MREVIIVMYNFAYQDGKLVYILNTPWVNAWLAFVHAMKSSPDPGPCNNKILLERDDVNKCWKPLQELKLASRTVRGDYRHVTPETWAHIQKLYPGSGPSIKVQFKEVTRNLF